MYRDPGEARNALSSISRQGPFWPRVISRQGWEFSQSRVISRQGPFGPLVIFSQGVWLLYGNSPSPMSIDRSRLSPVSGSFAATSKTAVWVSPTMGENVTMCLVPGICQSLLVLCYGNSCFVFFLSQLLPSVLQPLWSPSLLPAATALRDGEERGKIWKSM